MRVAINAISIKKGGAIVALDKLLSHFVRLQPDYEYHVIANATLQDSDLPCHKSINVHRFPWAERNYLLASLWYLVVLPVWLKRKRVEVLFSQTCYLPPFGPKRRVLLVQDAKYFYDVPGLLEGLSPADRRTFELKKLWTYYSVRAADHVTVQSQALADSIISRIPSARMRLKVIPHGPGFLDQSEATRVAPLQPGYTMELAYVALYRDYKNFEVLCRAIQSLTRRGIPVRLHLTLNLDEDPGAREVMNYARAIGVEDRIVNHGELAWQGVSELYRSSDVFVFPSVCESFGFPQVEAMAFGLPVLAADTPVNREICSYAACYFPADDEQRLADRIEEFYRNPQALALAGRLSAQRAADFDWARAASDTLRWMANGRNGR